jgi:hypothetical protein
MNYSVSVGYDSAGYYVSSSDIPGLDVEAKSLEALVGTVRDAGRRLLHEPSAKITIEPGIVLFDRVKRSHEAR